MTEPAQHRHDRQAAIPDWDQAALSSATAVVVGLGALGNEVAKNLALAGVGSMILVDPDTIELSNLPRSVLFRPTHVGHAKVDAARDALLELVPDIDIDSRQGPHMSAVGLGALRDSTVTISALDSIHARLSLIGRCAMVDAPLVDGATLPWGGEVRLRLSVEESCYGCSLDAAARAAQDDPLSCIAPSLAAPQAASIVTTAMIASWMTLAATRIIFGRPPAWRFLRMEGTAGTTLPYIIQRDPTCLNHRLVPDPKRLDISNAATIGQLLDELPIDARPHGWASTGYWACPKCDTATSATECPTCGEAALGRLMTDLAAVSPDETLRNVGVAPKEILTVVAGESISYVELSAASTA